MDLRDTPTKTQKRRAQYIKNVALCLVLALLLETPANAQNLYSRQDSLRGGITPERSWWDLTYYHLNVKVDADKKHLDGSNLMQYRVLKPHNTLQLELREPLEITEIVQNSQSLDFHKDGYTHFVALKKEQVPGEVYELTIRYAGTPTESPNPPWSGGVTWAEDPNGNDWVVTTCQGDGASLWWPNKDHPYDEPDSMLISITAPGHLMGVGNGRLRATDEHPDGSATFHWFVSNPINNYGVNMNIGDYAHFGEVYSGLNGDLDCDYYVLPANLEKAKKQFAEVSRMFEAFEHWFGPYPFYSDGFKVVEVPYAGMEHQSSVTYGNGFENGSLGRDVSGTGWGMKFDFIIVHEAAHEWFGNSITHKDIADMWIHESFASYAENLFLDYHFGTEAANAYVQGVRKNIVNDRPIVGTYGVHQRGSADMYYKGANVLHTLRQLVEDDALWRDVLTGLNREFFHSVVTGEAVENYISQKTDKDLQAFFDQYLRTADIPVLEYEMHGDSIKFRYTRVVEGFDMPVRAFVGGRAQWLFPNKEWQSTALKGTGKDFRFDANFYVNFKEVGK